MAISNNVREQTATTDISITVKRNEFFPVFSRSSYESRFPENLRLGEEILKVSASDRDSNDVITFRFDNSTDALLFFINPSTGSISLKKVWTNDQPTDFNVSMPDI